MPPEVAAAIVFLAPLVSALVQGEDAPSPASPTQVPRDPRIYALTVADALYSIPEVTGPLRLVPDLDGDGRADLIVEYDGKYHGSSGYRIEALSSVDGHSIRTLWSSAEKRLVEWDVGGDVDGDGVTDVIMCLTDNGEWTAGRVLIVSGTDGSELRDVQALPDQLGYGRSVAFLDDMNGDGCSEYAIGSVQCGVRDPRVILEEKLAGPDAQKAGLERRPAPGRVDVRSGHDGRRLWAHEVRAPHAFGVPVRNVGDTDGDGRSDLLIGTDQRSSEPLWLMSGANGESLGMLPNYGGPFGPAGDVDGDGKADIYLDVMDEHRGHHAGSTVILSANGDFVMDLRLPDKWWSKYSTTVPLGDVDGDRVPDFLLGGLNFQIPGSADPSGKDKPIDLGSLRLQDALTRESAPGNMSWESGAAWVYSGREQRVVLGVWGAPGSSDGMGLFGAPMPDLTGDGYPEIAICDARGAHVFAGPGPDPLHAPK